MTLSERFRDALSYAIEAHAGQLRKGTKISYLAHLLGVTGIALEHDVDEDEAIAAPLHDAAKDSGGVQAANRRRQSLLFSDLGVHQRLQV